MPKISIVMLLAVLLMMITGCESEDERLARFAEQSVDQQAQQNKAVTAQQQEIAEATRTLVEADAQSRADFAKLAGHLNAERQELNSQRDGLERERREIAAERRTIPLLTGALEGLALALICALPLMVALYVLRAVTQSGQDDSSLNDLLVNEFLSLEAWPPSRAALLNAPLD